MAKLVVPDDFPFSKVAIPLSIHYSFNDKLAVALNVEKLIPQLKNVVYVQRIHESMGHLDYVWSQDAATLIYSKVLNVFQKY